MPGSGQAVELTAVEGALALSLVLPEGATPAASTRLDLSSAPGARLDLQRAWTLAGSGRIELACARAPAERWIEGLEGAILDGASATVRKAGGYASMSSDGATSAGAATEQIFHGRTAAGDVGVTLHGKHLLGFAGSPPEISLCTLVCVEPATAGERPQGEAAASGDAGCQRAVEAFDASGFVAAPPPGLLSRAVAWTAAHPQPVGAVAAAAALLIVFLLLRFRPRPRP